jgi:hypothetical protein
MNVFTFIGQMTNLTIDTTADLAATIQAAARETRSLVEGLNGAEAAKTVNAAVLSLRDSAAEMYLTSHTSLLDACEQAGIEVEDLYKQLSHNPTQTESFTQRLERIKAEKKAAKAATSSKKTAKTSSNTNS